MAVQALVATTPLKRKRQDASYTSRPAPSLTQFEMLPPELLEKIFTYVTLPFEKPTTGVQMPQQPNSVLPVQNLSLYSSLFVSRMFLAAATSVLYRKPVLTSPQAFELLEKQISKRPDLGSLVRELDLTNLIVTLDDNWIRGVGPKSLLSLLEQTPLLQEVKIGGAYGGARLHAGAWECIFSKLQQLRIVTINDSDSRNQLQEFHRADKNRSPGWIQELAITKSFALPQTTARNILSSQPRLESLNFSGSLIAGDWFSSLSSSARLRHLNLSDCLGGLDEDGCNPTVDFLSTHPALSSLESLNLSSSTEIPTLNLTTKDMTRILSHLPIETMRVLDIRGTPLTRDQLPLLQRFINLEELHVSHDLCVLDMETLVLSGAYTFPKPQSNLSPAQELLQVDPGKMVNISDMGSLARNVLICKLMQRVNRVLPLPSSLSSSSATSARHSSSSNDRKQQQQNGLRRSKLRYLDLSNISRTQILKILDSVLLAEESMPLEVIELGPSALDWCDVGVKQLFRSAGWRPRCVGKRSWVERV